MGRIHRRTRRDESGFAGGAEAIAFGVLIFVFGTLVIAGAWGVIDGRLATTAAAREAARSYVEAGSETQAMDAARNAAESAMRGHSRELVDLEITPIRRGGTTFRRCNGIQVLVRARVPRAPIPLLSRAGGAYTVTSRHDEHIDPYRSGLTGASSC
jgi:Flp pilus assembly protein TadG